MKTIILMFTVVIFVTKIFAQDPLQYTKTFAPIDTGYIFYDGKYIDSPYIIEIKDLTIFINGNPVSKKVNYPETNAYYFDNDVDVPPSLNNNSTIDEAMNAKEPTKNIPYITAKIWYMFSHFSEEEARMKIEAYVKSFPNVKNLTGNNGIYTLETYSGETRKIGLGDFQMKLMNKKWGPGGSGGISKENVIESLNEGANSLNDIIKNGAIEFYNKGKLYNISSDEVAKKKLLIIKEILENSNKTVVEKTNILLENQIILSNDAAIKFLDNLKFNIQLLNKINKIQLKLNKNDGGNIYKNEKNDSLNLKSLSDPSYCTSSKSAFAWFPFTYDGPFSNYYSEISNVQNKIINQDFQNFTLFTDLTTDNPNLYYQSEDELIGNCFYSNFKSMQNGGFLYVGTHGISYGVALMILNTYDDAVDWIDGDDNLFTIYQSQDLFWTNSDGSLFQPWIILSNPDWPSFYWNNNLTTLNSIVILSVCESYTSGWANNCGGGVVFSYNSVTTSNACVYNNKHLLERMNGTIHGSSIFYRKAGEAFDNMISTGQISQLHFSGDDAAILKMIPEDNANITLCPSTNSKSEGEVTDQAIPCFIEFDTWCDASQSANDILIPNIISGTVTIGNRQWVRC